MKIYKKERGQLSVMILIFVAVALTLISGFIVLVTTFLQISFRALNKAQAFSIAEAGIEYYRWHLAHAPQDYQDGTGNPGPYTHDFQNKDGETIGQFSLDLTPP